MRNVGNHKRPRRRRMATWLAAVLVAGIGLVGCGPGSASGGSTGSQVGNELTFGIPAAPPTLNPATGDPAYTSVYQWAYDPLIVMQPDGSYAPGLAVEWGYVGEGNKTYELTLRKGVKFSDGTPLDAQAVKTYLDYARAQKTGSVPKMLANIESIEVTGPLAVRIHLKKSDPRLTFYFAQAFGAGNIASPKAVANPSMLNKDTYGAGPYMLDASQTVTGDHYTFVPNPHYWDKSRQHWQKVTLKVISNPSSMVQAMRAGQVDAALGNATTLQAAKSAGLTVQAPPQALSGLNLMDRSGKLSKPLADVRVRRALNYAVDRQAIAKALFGDPSLALSQYALPGQPAYVKALNDMYSHNVDKAKKLLAAAGYPNGFTLRVVDTKLNGLHKLIQAMAGQFKKIGVNLKITTKSTANQYFVGMTSGKFPTAAIGYGLATMGTLHTGFVDPQGPFNPFHYKDPKLGALYEQYFAAGKQDRVDLAKEINTRLVKQAWTVPVVGAPLSYYTVEGITGLKATTANAGVPWLTEIRPAS